jgi:hypothetical protein
MMNGTYAEDSHLYWAAALVAALVDLVFIFFFIRWIDRNRFQRLKIPLVIVASLVWCGIYTTAVWAFWETCYSFVFPDWVRWFVVFFGLLMGGVAYFFWWLALKIPGNAILIFALLAGLHSLPGHLIGMYGRGMMEKCPILIDVSNASALVFGVFEFIFYWYVVMALSELALFIYDRLFTPSNISNDV